MARRPVSPRLGWPAHSVRLEFRAHEFPRGLHRDELEWLGLRIVAQAPVARFNLRDGREESTPTRMPGKPTNHQRGSDIDER
jgi:hypothetical protein